MKFGIQNQQQQLSYQFIYVYEHIINIYDEIQHQNPNKHLFTKSIISIST